MRKNSMPDMICDCPYRFGNGECELELMGNIGERVFPRNCPKKHIFSQGNTRSYQLENSL